MIVTLTHPRRECEELSAALSMSSGPSHNVIVEFKLSRKYQYANIIPVIQVTRGVEVWAPSGFGSQVITHDSHNGPFSDKHRIQLLTYAILDSTSNILPSHFDSIIVSLRDAGLGRDNIIKSSV